MFYKDIKIYKNHYLNNIIQCRSFARPKRSPMPLGNAIHFYARHMFCSAVTDILV